METEETSCSGSSFTTASTCAPTVLSFGDDVEMDSETRTCVSLRSEESCRTAGELSISLSLNPSLFQ
uniref:Uncharacterized protein n=1 Tax=Steinernema glaseri TaxID=37863 RepID=A0A1I7XZ24_9BILA